MRRHGYLSTTPGAAVPGYYEYHGADPSTPVQAAYYGINPHAYRSQESSTYFHRKSKKSFAEKLSNKLDKLAKPKERDRVFNKAYQEVYRDHFGNILVQGSTRNGRYSGSGDPWPHHSTSPMPKRSFHNVIHRGRSAPGGSSNNGSHPAANRTWSGWPERGGGSFTGLHPVAHSTVSNDPTIYGEVLYDNYHNFAINSNVCMCEDYLGGTQRGKKAKKRCKKCGFDRLGGGTQMGIRRSVSEESVNADPYEQMRRRRLVNPKPVFYDEQDEYEDIDFSYVPLRTNSTRKYHSKATRNRSPQRNSMSPSRKNVRTQSMIVNNRNKPITKENKEMHNIAIRSSPIRSVSSAGKTKSNEQAQNVVTVNGCATKNSSIIYLSPDAKPAPSSIQSLPEKDYPGANTITVSTVPTPNNSQTTATNLLISQDNQAIEEESLRISPYDLIKKYIQDSPANSLSDSNLSSDDPPEDKSDFTDSDMDDHINERINHYTSASGFKISGQKIQIYSDGSVTATDIPNPRAYGLSESEDESDKESEYSNYDADCSVVESPRIQTKLVENTPQKPPRRKSSEKELPSLTEKIQQFTTPNPENFSKDRSSPRLENVRTFPRAATPKKDRQKLDSNEKVVVNRKSSSESQKSVASRSKSFNGSRESLFGSVDFKTFGISKNFSSEIIQEIYGSKTSLLKHIDQQREERKLTSNLYEPKDLGRKKPDEPKSVVRTDFTDKLSIVSQKPQLHHCLCENTGSDRLKDESVKIDTVNSSVGRINSQVDLHSLRGQRHMFNDTTRLRFMSRPSLKDALQSFSTGSTKQGRVGKSQSFRERMINPLRPRDPPPPPPQPFPVEGESLPSLAKKFFSFNKNEIRRINKFLGINNPGEIEKQAENNIYDICENDETSNDLQVTVINNSIFYTGDTKTSTPQANKKNITEDSITNYISPVPDPVKPPRVKRERSKSFTPRSKHLQKSSIFNRSLSQIPKSSSSSSLTGKHLSRSDSNSKKIRTSLMNPNENSPTQRTLSSSDLVHIFPDEERRSFKDIRKILSSPSISSSASSSTNQIYRPKSQLSNSSSVINSIKEEHVDVHPGRDSFFDHIYEEINNKDVANKGKSSKRPLPPLPPEKQPSPSRTSPIIADPISPVKSIFEGASKYEILNYLEDARERGLTDCDLDSEDEEGDNDEDPEPSANLILTTINTTNRLSKISTESSGSGSDSEHVMMASKEKLSNVEIERNDSGLGSETSRGRGTAKVVVRKRSDEETEDLTCLDCDHVLEPLQDAVEGKDAGECSLCDECATRRVERKEIITEIIETEIKYGRDLRIIYEEFYRPMMVAGLLSPEHLANVFLNVEELIQVNAKFTEGLKDAIEIALDQGDEDMCTVSIGKLFLEASPMLGAFKSYCTRQGSASSLLASLEREKELLRIFLKVSQMENTILRRMNLSSFLMVPVQRVTRYPLLLSRLMKVTPEHHGDKEALQESRELIEQGLDSMNQETTRDSGTTKLWRRISMINPPYRRSDNQIDLLGSTTWGVRKMVLETLGWGKEAREDISFVLESRLLYTQPTDVNWRSLFTVKMSPINALLVILGQNTISPSHRMLKEESQRFPKETGCREAAIILLKEKGMRYSPIREPLLLDKCVVCWEQDWDDCFEVTEFSSKESYIFKGEDLQQTLQWFRCIKFYCSGLGGWRRRRNGLANIMINGMARSEEIGRENYSLIS